MIGCLPTQALAFFAVFVYATHATHAIEWKPGFTPTGLPSRTICLSVPHLLFCCFYLPCRLFYVYICATAERGSSFPRFIQWPRLSQTLVVWCDHSVWALACSVTRLDWNLLWLQSVLAPNLTQKFSRYGNANVLFSSSQNPMLIS